MRFFVFLVLGVVLASLASAAEVQSISVQPGYVQTLSANLNSGDTISGSISVTGGSGDDIDFSIKDPSGNEIFTKRRVAKGTTFSVTATQAGAYTFVFDNSFSLLSGKNVQLSYSYAPKSSFPSGSGGGRGFCGTGAILLAILGGLAILKK